MYLIYKITNEKTGKSYIGYTSKTIEDRWKIHLKFSKRKNNKNHFSCAIRKYNLSDWKKEILISKIKNIQEAERKEIEMISKYDTYKNGYNSTLGGIGLKETTELVRKNMSVSAKKAYKNNPNLREIKRNIIGLEIRAKTWNLILPNKKYVSIFNLKKYCRQHDLNYGSLFWALNNKKEYKGIKLQKESK
jgi:hypothetical protein